MMDKNFLIAENDVLLMDFLSAELEIVAGDCLSRLFEETIIPQIRAVSASFLTLSKFDKDEIQSDAQIRVLRK